MTLTISHIIMLACTVYAGPEAVKCRREIAKCAHTKYTRAWDKYRQNPISTRSCFAVPYTPEYQEKCFSDSIRHVPHYPQEYEFYVNDCIEKKGLK